MADAFLQVVLENLNSLIQREIGLLWGVEKEMKKLSSTLSTIRAVLEDAERKQFQDKAIQDWLRKLKHATYVVDDILDEYATEAIRLESKAQNSGLLGKVHSSFLSCYTPENILFRHKIGNKMKEITEELDAIADEKNKFHLSEVVAENRFEVIERRQTSSILTQPQVYGREEDKEKIVEQLVGRGSDCPDVLVYPIIGLGGLGKTTLAQLVFNDETVTRHFELRIWVCVSEDFEVKRVIKAIIESASGKACESLDLDPLQRCLRDILNGKRYLLVLDDVWNEDQEKWDMVKSVLACGSRGTSIITTTRLGTVASIMGGTLSAHHLSVLSDDDCWSLFKQRAFGHETEDHPNLVAIGKEIVKKCGGVPLAAKALGGLLRFKREEHEWISVRDSEIWNLPQDENSILPALRLSYYHLPPELRQCFAYCAVFQKDERIRKEYLIHLWMANGFISCNGRLELEDIGNGIWNELYRRSFFQDVEEDYFGNIIRFKMHDLVYDLAQSIMGDECLTMEVQKSSSTVSNRKFHHVTLVVDDSNPLAVFPEALHKAESLRTFLLQHRRYCFYDRAASKLSCEFTKFGSLRVLDASNTPKMKGLSSSIGSLKHLRYLNLSDTDIRTLPKTICSLWNLQILNLDYCRALESLPKHLARLRSLQHLYLKDCQLIQSMPPKIGQLTCLKTLTRFVVSKRKGCRLSELQDLNLRGRLSVEHLERVGNLMDAKKSNLIGKQNLRWLDLSWESNSESELQENVEQVLEALQPHPNLQQLNIMDYKGTNFPLWMRDSVLKNIVDIGLSNCTNCLQLPPFGQLPSLRRLWIYGMNFVGYIYDSDFHGRAVTTSGFPSLEVLDIDELPNLKGLFKDQRRELFPRLRQMSIENCPKLMLPCLPSLKELTIRRCNEVVLSTTSNLSSLISLYVYGNEDVVSFPEEMLRNLTLLESLAIRSFTKLKVLPTALANLTSLKSLLIYNCQELESLPEQGLRGLQSLRELQTLYSEKLKSLSEGLQHLTALETLRVISCPELASLPASIQSLTKLQTLYIKSCPELERRCEKESGEDWYKIAHIPQVDIFEEPEL